MTIVHVDICRTVTRLLSICLRMPRADRLNKCFGRRLRRLRGDYQDRELIWLGFSTQSTNLVRDTHSVRYPVRRTTGNPSWYVLSQWYSRLGLNIDHLVGIRRDSYCAYSDYGVKGKKKREEGNTWQNFGRFHQLV